MTISLQCPDCDKKLSARDELVGKRVKCPSCGGSVTVQTERAAEPETKRSATGPPASEPSSETPPQSERTPSVSILMLQAGAGFVVFGAGTMCAIVVFQGVLTVVSGCLALAGVIVMCVALARIQKAVVGSYPIRAQMMLGAHLQPDDGELVWVYGMTAPNELVSLLLPMTATRLTQCFLIGLTERRLLLLNTTQHMAGELAFLGLEFSGIRGAWAEDCADPYRVGPFAASRGKMLHILLQDGTKFKIGSAYKFPAFPPHQENLEKIAAFCASRRSGGSE